MNPFGATAGTSFGAPPLGGFGAQTIGAGTTQAVATLPTPSSLAVLGPGYSGPGQHWSSGTDLSNMADDWSYGTAPQPLQNHLKDINFFVKDERKACTTLTAHYHKLLDDDNSLGYSRLRNRLDALTDGTFASFKSSDHIGLGHHDRCVLLHNEIQNASSYLNLRKRAGDRMYGNEDNEHVRLFPSTAKRLAKRLVDLESQLLSIEAIVQQTSNVQPMRPSEIIASSMESELSCFINTAGKVAELHNFVIQQREIFSRQFGELEASEIFGPKTSVLNRVDKSTKGRQTTMAYDPRIEPQTPAPLTASGVALPQIPQAATPQVAFLASPDPRGTADTASPSPIAAPPGATVPVSRRRRQ